MHLTHRFANRGKRGGYGMTLVTLRSCRNVGCRLWKRIDGLVGGVVARGTVVAGPGMIHCGGQERSCRGRRLSVANIAGSRRRNVVGGLTQRIRAVMTGRACARGCATVVV